MARFSSHCNHSNTDSWECWSSLFCLLSYYKLRRDHHGGSSILNGPPDSWYIWSPGRLQPLPGHPSLTNEVISKLPLAIRAELLVLHDHCNLHGHRRYERSNTFSRGLIYIGGNSTLSLMNDKRMGKAREKMLLRYYRVYDFVYEITRLVPFIMPSGQGLYGTKLIDIIKESILFSKRVGWQLL